MKKVYLDNHSATRPCKAALEAMQPLLTRRWGNPTAPHDAGQEVLCDLEAGYRGICELLGAGERDQIVFTSSGCEAVNHAVLSTYFDLTREAGLNHFITSQLDEAPAILAIERLEEVGCSSTLVPVTSQGIVTPEALGDAFSPRTAMVSLSWGNALTGVMQPVAELAEVCRQRGILFHLEASHILGKIDFDLGEIGADLISFGGDLLHAPRGTGALWIREGLEISPLLCGGREQAGLRGGSFSTAGLAALGAACREALEARDFVCTETARLRDKLEGGIVKRVRGARALFTQVERLPTTTCLLLPGVSSDALLYRLNQEGVAASFGGGAYQKLAVQLEACGMEAPHSDCAVSFTLSRESTEEEMDRAIEITVRVAQELQKVSQELMDEAVWGAVN